MTANAFAQLPSRLESGAKVLQGQVLQGAGALLGGVASLVGAILILSKIKPIANFFASRAALVAARDAFELQAIQQTERALAAERSRDNWQSNAEAIKQNYDMLNARLRTLEADAPRVKALMLYAKENYHYTVFLENRLKTAGIDIGRPRPVLPNVLEDLERE